MTRWTVRGFAAIGVVVVGWVGFSWARLTYQRWRAAADLDAYGSWSPPR